MHQGIIPNLSQEHRSRVSITLTRLDEALIKFEEYAQGREVHSILYRENNNLDPVSRAGLLAEIASIRAIMEELQEHLLLKASALDIVKSIRGHCYLLWVEVTEMTGKYLRGFGEPPPELVRYLDPKAHQILRHLDHMKVLLANPRS